MNKEIRLTSLINGLINNTNTTEEKRFLEYSENAMRESALNYNGQIFLPSQRSILTGSLGIDVAPVINPLRPTFLLPQLGAKTYNDIKHGELFVPLMGKNNVFWEAQNEQAKDGGTEFSHISLKPHRLCAYIDVEYQFLQGGDSIEQALISDLEAAMYNKLESTILSDTTGETQPSGIFSYSGIPQTTINSYSNIITLNSYVDNANANGKRAYIGSNSMKNYLRTLSKGEGQGFVLEENINGESFYNTSNCLAGAGLYGDFSNLLIGQWQGTSILVDSITKMGNSIVRIICNGYFDAVVARPEAFSIGKLPITQNKKP
jgi:HK97 family phage major capsid protein